MLNDIKLRVIITLLVTAAAVVYLVPSFTTVPDLWKKYLPSEKLRLGLDLQGGMHLVLEVETQKAIESTLDRYASDMKEVLMNRKIRFRNVERSAAGTISLEITDKDSVSEFNKIIKEQYPDLEVKSSDIVEGREKVALKMKDKRAEDVKKHAVEQSLETIRNRIDQFGVTEPEIAPQGEDRIAIQLPGIKDSRSAIELIGKTARLEFMLVDEEGDIGAAMRGMVPPGDIVLNEKRIDRKTGRMSEIPILLKNRAVLTGDSVETARVAISDRFGEPYVALKFKPEGAREFDRITAENVKRRLAIVLDGVVYSAPVIQERISGGDAQITGSFSEEEAKILAIALRSGALPAPVRILEQVTVGPSLGQDSIETGIRSMIIGTLLVIIFMGVYYKASGLIADVALLLNVILTLGAMSLLNATLTLPGIAGMVLTVGMAVDSNVLIFERTREEIRLGKSPRAAIEAGFSKAFITILDTHITTLISAVLMFQFGTGPIKGFAVTLSVGLIFSLFTAVFVTKIIFDYLIWNRKVKAISI